MAIKVLLMTDLSPALSQPFTLRPVPRRPPPVPRPRNPRESAEMRTRPAFRRRREMPFRRGRARPPNCMGARQDNTVASGNVVVSAPGPKLHVVNRSALARCNDARGITETGPRHWTDPLHPARGARRRPARPIRRGSPAPVGPRCRERLRARTGVSARASAPRPVDCRLTGGGARNGPLHCRGATVFQVLPAHQPTRSTSFHRRSSTPPPPLSLSP
jgi:hypothetical protein